MIVVSSTSLVNAPITEISLPTIVTIQQDIQLQLAQRRAEAEPGPEPESPKPPKPKPKPKPAKTVFIVTAYTAGPESTGKRPGDKGYGITASGKKVAEGRTIACPPNMAFGARVVIEGLGERVCEDRGGAIKGNRLDVYMESVSQARQFGRRSLEVEIRR